MVAAVLLIALGVVSIVIGANVRDTVDTSLEREDIVGGPYMTPRAIELEANEFNLPSRTQLPSCWVAYKPIDSGDRASCFASFLRIHTLEVTGDHTYDELGRYRAKPGTVKIELAPDGGTENVRYAVRDPETGEPIESGPRGIWVAETALGTALDATHSAEQLSELAIVIGIALLLTGLGLAILVAAGATRDPDTAFRFLAPERRT